MIYLLGNIDSDDFSKVEHLCEKIRDRLDTYARAKLIYDAYGPVYNVQFYCNDAESMITFKSTHAQEVYNNLCDFLSVQYDWENLQECEEVLD